MHLQSPIVNHPHAKQNWCTAQEPGAERDTTEGGATHTTTLEIAFCFGVVTEAAPVHLAGLHT